MLYLSVVHSNLLLGVPPCCKVQNINSLSSMYSEVYLLYVWQIKVLHLGGGREWSRFQ
jgi:hypothetical protein